MALPFDIRPVAPAHALGARFFVSPRFIQAVHSARPFALVGYGELTALPGREDRWHWEEDPPPFPEAIGERLPLPALGLDLVFGDWERAEAAVLAPLDAVDVEDLAEALDRRWLWTVSEDDELRVIDRLAETETSLGTFVDRVGPGIFRSLARPLGAGVPILGAFNGEEGFWVDIAFVDGDVDGVAASDLRLTRVPDPTPEQAGWLGPERLETLMDQVRQMAQRHGWHFQVVLGEDLRLVVAPEGSVRPIRQDQSPAARLGRALGRGPGAKVPAVPAPRPVPASRLPN